MRGLMAGHTVYGVLGFDALSCIGVVSHRAGVPTVAARLSGVNAFLGPALAQPTQPKPEQKKIHMCTYTTT